MTGRGNNRLRMAYIEAAWIAIRKDTALCSAYLRYCQKMEKERGNRTNSQKPCPYISGIGEE